MIDVLDRPGIFEVVVSERVTEGQLEALKQKLEVAVSDEVDPRVLCIVKEFWGFDSRAAWEDLCHWLRHTQRPARVAFLTEPKWVRMIADPDRPLCPSWEIRAFETSEEREARMWLASSDTDERVERPHSPRTPRTRRRPSTMPGG